MGDGVGSEGERLSRLRLDELLEELQIRIDATRSTRRRVHTLLEAVLSVGGEIDLQQVLRRIVEAAVVLVDAEYGAFGVVEGNGLSQFLTSGMSAEQADAIGRWPSGHGVLGQLIRHPEPLRLSEISQHPGSCGFPAGHPPMHSFLGVPVRVRDQAFGNLYLTEKRGGEGFDSEDETVLRTLAVAAGVAVEKARLYQEARDRQRWLEANARIIGDLLSGNAEVSVLRGIVEETRRILDADLGVIALPTEGGSELRVVTAAGVDAEDHRGLVLPVDGSFMGAALAAGRPITTVHVQKDPRVTVGPPRWKGLGPVVAVPMVTDDGNRGVLLLGRQERGAPFSEDEIGPLAAFAGQAALAMELAERRRISEQVALLEDRDRIARDLHDLAIQRLFATGMTLQSAMRFVDHPEASERLMRAVDDLDETIKIIRSTIFGLRTRDADHRGLSLRSQVITTVEGAGRSLGFSPSLIMEGLIDTEVPGTVADAVLAVLEEALSNVARHAEADAAQVSLVVAEGRLTVTVADNGIGLPAHVRHSGLDNLAERARRLGGRMEAVAAPDGGTRLVWQVPLAGGTPA